MAGVGGKWRRLYLNNNKKMKNKKMTKGGAVTVLYLIFLYGLKNT